MERRIRMPEGAANLLYEKMEAMVTKTKKQEVKEHGAG